MLKKILKKAGVLLMAVSILSLLGCNQVNEATAKKVEEKLEKKYGEKFEVQALGNRWGTKENNTVKSIVKATKNNVIFDAVMNKNGKLESETYLIHKIGAEAGSVLTQNLQKEGITSKVKLRAAGGKKLELNDSTITLPEYIKSHSPKKFVGIMILEDSENASPEKIIKGFKSAYVDLSETKLQTLTLIVASEDYDDAVEVFNENADVSDDWLEEFKIKAKFYLYMDEEGFQSDHEEFQNQS
ncbi:hypothetical protein D1B31_03890 [Neobacillus notoginsengisoli]|uniref:Uncharacterized protein n=1 Tax=Neobacillus notoginsengisoli TaxID=1578198 RepID=A0A417YYC6_9BACI|nr:hypothetical protein [Neobacillus notoginsengisoli]RHW42736.1 hypothetical protein D1B31_03890 [Neobacillus notoginsengisoli]